MNEYLFDDNAMRDFLIHGCCIRPLEGLSDAFHDSIYNRIGEVFAQDGNPGNNLLPHVPELQQVFDNPVVRGTLTSLLGPSYIMHCHRHPHVTGPHGKGMGWHKDSYWGYYRIRDHHPRWIMAMYYPQEVPVDFGPTGAVPGSHYYETMVPPTKGMADELVDSAGEGIPAVLGKGNVLFIHFDLWHKAYPNFLDKTRYMFKFQFTRMDEPVAPTWNRTSVDIPLGPLDDHPRAPVWKQMWRWLSGDSRWTTSGDPSRLREALHDDCEITRLSAAYVLGGLGKPGVDILLDALHGDNDTIRRDAGYGLAVAGDDSVGALVDALDSENENTRAHAVYALGDRGARVASVVDRLASLASDPSPFVRRTLADALGYVHSHPQPSVAALRTLLADTDDQVRFNSAYALAKFGGDAAPAVPQLVDALSDPNRYVRGHASTALEQIGTPDALQGLLHHLQAVRYCPLTTRDSTF